MRRESIRYARSADGTNVAWAECGSGGATILLAPNAISEIRSDWESPFTRAILASLAKHFRVLRWDQRGCGSSSRGVHRHGVDAWAEDIEAVAKAARVDEPFVLFGISGSAGAVATYAARHPDKLSHVVFYGASRRGMLARKIDAFTAYHNARRDLLRAAFEAAHPGARLLIASETNPDLSAEEMDWFQRRLLRAVTAEDAIRLFDAYAEVDVRETLPLIRTPALVMHAAERDGDYVQNGERFAASIPGARFVQLPGAKHILTPRDEAWGVMIEHLIAFVIEEGAASESKLAGLSPREREILDGVCAGLSNEAIGAQRGISEKTVRNHLTQIFTKLGVRTRTQAALLAMGAARR